MVQKAALAKIVGRDNTDNAPATLEAFSRDMSFANPVRPAYVVRPRTAEEVQKLVKLANETNTPLVPVSSGAPHFRGDTVPGIGGAVIVDLSRMKKMIFVDRPRRVAMVEPGVTFGELIPAGKKGRAQAQYAFTAAEVQVCCRQHARERACNNAQVSMGHIRPLGLRRGILWNR